MRRVGDRAGVGGVRAEGPRNAQRTIRSILARAHHAAGGVRLRGQRTREVVGIGEAIGRPAGDLVAGGNSPQGVESGEVGGRIPVGHLREAPQIAQTPGVSGEAARLRLSLPGRKRVSDRQRAPVSLMTAWPARYLTAHTTLAKPGRAEKSSLSRQLLYPEPGLVSRRSWKLQGFQDYAKWPNQDRHLWLNALHRKRHIDDVTWPRHAHSVVPLQ